MKTILITGATSGIGRATAYLLAKEKNRLILCGRRKERLNEITQLLSPLCEVFTLCFDIREKGNVVSSISSLPEKWKEIDVLINNAGNAHGLSPIQDGDTNDWDAMIDINVKGLLYISKILIPGMIERKSGHIINIGSIAGLEVYPNGNVYCASKFAVDAVTIGMRMDLISHNIKVSLINPGLVDTEFSLVRFKGDKEKAKAVYNGIVPLCADDIAEVVHFILSRPKHVNIADLLILPTSQASASIINRNIV
jgi:3-hydroxy acid dehydrogenase/malonic semialdehyde reductase